MPAPRRYNTPYFIIKAVISNIIKGLSQSSLEMVELKTKALVLSLMMALVLTGAALAQSSGPEAPEPVVLTDTQGEYPLGLHLEILEDPSRELTIDDVSSPELDAKFITSQAQVPNYGFTNSAYWVRFRLDNQTSQTQEWLLEQGFANTHYVDLYTPLPSGKGFAVKQTGVLRPANTRDVSYPRIVFNLIILPQSQQTYYLRFQNGASMTLPLTLWTQAAFLKHSLVEQLSMGIFYGILIGLLFYNLFLLYSLREASYFYFVLLLASLIIEEVVYDGYWGIFVIPNQNFLTQYYQPLSFSLLIASMLLFSDSFLELKTRLPKLHRLNLVVIASWGVLVLLTPFTSYHLLANLMVPGALFSLIVVCIDGFASWKSGFRSARFFMVAWLGMITSIFWVLLIRLGLVSSTFFSENIYRFGMVWMAVCWSIALADRINLLKAETENANRDLRNSEHRLSQILDGLPLGVVLYGNDQKAKYANRRTDEILSDLARNIKPDLSAGRTLKEAIPYFSLKTAGSQEAYTLERFPVFDALQGNAAAADDVEMIRGDERVALEIQASPVLDSEGNVESAVVAIQDITRRKQAEAELAEYRKHLELLVEKRTEELSAINEQLSIEANERKLLEQSLHQRIGWLSAVNKAHQTMAGVAGLKAVYRDLSCTILNLLGAALVFIVRWDSQTEESEVYCSFLDDDTVPEITIVNDSFSKDSLLRRDIELGKTIVWSADQATAFPVSLVGCFQDHGIQAAVLAPMMVRKSITGVLGVAVSMPVPARNSQEIDLIERMALGLADLTQDAILLDQALALATLEERNRLARDLHDSVTQVLFSATLLAEVLPQVWRRDPEQGYERLDRLRRLTRGALAEMRTMLLELRPTAVINTPLNDLLTQLAEAVTSRSGLPFQLEIEQIPTLPEDVHVNYYRIAQEALNNVVKHAQAEQVSMSLSAASLAPQLGGGARYEVKMVIQDDGVGYSGAQRRSDQLGISIMQERAAAIGARLIQESQPGHGTQVTLIWISEAGI
jgi:signal transduction histidine kinase/PAS domain-containing protein